MLFQDTWELVLQQRNPDKDSWPGMWDISSAGHSERAAAPAERAAPGSADSAVPAVSAGDGALDSAQRELHEELGLQMPKEAFQPLFTYRQEFAGTFHGRHFVNNEFNHVFLVTFTAPLPREAFRLQEEEVADVKFVAFPELKRLLEAGDPDHITYLAGLDKHDQQVRSGPSTRVLTRVGGREEVMHGRSTRPTDTADPAAGAGAATTRPPRRTAAPARGVPVGKPARAGDTVLILVVRRRGREGARGEALTDGPWIFPSPPRAAVPGLLRHPRA